MAPKLKLVYFPVDGRGEIIRLLCHIGGLKYEEEIVPFMKFAEKKPSYPYGSLPILIVDDKVTLPQTVAIARYLARITKLTGKDPLEDAQIDAIVDACNELHSDYRMIWPAVVMNSKNEDFMNWAMSMFGNGLKEFEGHPELKAENYKKYAEKAVNPKLNKFEEILGNNKTGWLVGHKMTWADVYVAEYMHRMMVHVEPKALDGHPKVKALHDRVYAVPAVAEFKKTAPEYPF